MSIKKPGILKHVKKSKSQFANYFYFSFDIKTVRGLLSKDKNESIYIYVYIIRTV